MTKSRPATRGAIGSRRRNSTPLKSCRTFRPRQACASPSWLLRYRSHSRRTARSTPHVNRARAIGLPSFSAAGAQSIRAATIPAQSSQIRAAQRKTSLIQRAARARSRFQHTQRRRQKPCSHSPPQPTQTTARPALTRSRPASTSHTRWATGQGTLACPMPACLVSSDSHFAPASNR